jgi:hypothetical protein
LIGELKKRHVSNLRLLYAELVLDRLHSELVRLRSTRSPLAYPSMRRR